MIAKSPIPPLVLSNHRTCHFGTQKPARDPSAASPDRRAASGACSLVEDTQTLNADHNLHPIPRPSRLEIPLTNPML